MSAVFTGDYRNKYHDNGLRMIFHTSQWYKDVFNGVKTPGGEDYSVVGISPDHGCGQEPYTTYADAEPSPARIAEEIAHNTYGADEVLAWEVCVERYRKFLEDAYYTQKKIFLDQKEADILAGIESIADETRRYLSDLLKPDNLETQMDNIRDYIVRKLESKGMMPPDGADAKKELVDSIVTSALTRLQNYVLDEYTSGIPHLRGGRWRGTAGPGGTGNRF